MQPISAFLRNTKKRHLNLFFAGIVAVLFVRANNVLSDWKFTHFLFNYDYGFIKRGLLGELYSAIFEQVSFQNALWTSYFIVIVLSLVFVKIWSQAFFKERDKGSFLFALLAVLSPFTIQHHIYDLGRFDAYTTFLSLCAIFSVLYARTATKTILVNLLLSMAIFIHEASFFMFVPLVLGYWLWRDGKKHLNYVLLSFIWLFCLTFLVATQGQMTQITISEHMQILQRTYGEHVVESSLGVLYKGGLLENIKMTLINAVRPWSLIHHAIMLLLLFPTFYLLLKLVKTLWEELDVRAKLLLLASLSPLALYPIGYDHFRWWSLAMTNLFIAIALLMQQSLYRQAVSSILEKQKGIIYIALLLSLILGPIGITSSFDSVIDLGRFLLQ